MGYINMWIEHLKFIYELGYIVHFVYYVFRWCRKMDYDGLAHKMDIYLLGCGCGLITSLIWPIMPLIYKYAEKGGHDEGEHKKNRFTGVC